MIHADILGERARLTPEKTALVCVRTGERFSYRQLNDRAIRCAKMLLERCRLARGDRFAVLTHNRVEFLDAFFAAAKTGTIIVPLNTRQTPHELDWILRDSGARAVLFESDFRDAVRILRAELEIPHWICLDSAGEVGAASYVAEAGRFDAAGWRNVACSPEDLVCLLYTSGTTGKPKGVMTPHRMLAWNGYNTVACWGLRDDDVSPIFTPLYHAGGLGAFLIPIFTVGGTIILHRGFDAEEVWCTIEREGCTVVLGVPTIWKLLLDAPAFATADISRVRWFISGGAPLPLYIMEAYQKRGVVFKQGYGLSEVGVNCFSMTVEESARKAGSIGKPMMHTRARLVDANGKDVPAGEVGELWLRGPHVSLGYWNQPQATAAALDAEGWFHTGDQARCDEEGFFYIAGRTKDMLISGGVNVYPAEIEGELLLHPAVEDAAVIGAPHATWGEVGVAFVVLRQGGAAEAATPESLAEFLSRRLARYKIPREFIYVESLPRTAYGKVVKGDLQNAYAARRANSQHD
jgi:fatty-acyl-CoA synthase